MVDSEELEMRFTTGNNECEYDIIRETFNDLLFGSCQFRLKGVLIGTPLENVIRRAGCNDFKLVKT